MSRLLPHVSPPARERRWTRGRCRHGWAAGSSDDGGERVAVGNGAGCGVGSDPFAATHALQFCSTNTFNTAVDVEFDIPDYFDVVKHPMDLGTVRKLAADCYCSPWEHEQVLRNRVESYREEVECSRGFRPRRSVVSHESVVKLKKKKKKKKKQQPQADRRRDRRAENSDILPLGLYVKELSAV
ncbi:hypothetical protein B296_00008139 [Ensete ventricosum]|uniref:Bromo domain-containing protein n=1 Tax=Ensete ventricosum TaxID=4639 RepID=A0A426XPF0_ENSVE|nr:hypothetical protein B296_00008139 [Ensete ventricosum]